MEVSFNPETVFTIEKWLGEQYDGNLDVPVIIEIPEWDIFGDGSDRKVKFTVFDGLRETEDLVIDCFGIVGVHGVMLSTIGGLTGGLSEFRRKYHDDPETNMWVKIDNTASFRSVAGCGCD